MENQTMTTTPIVPTQEPQVAGASSNNWVKIVSFVVLVLCLMAGSVFIGIQIGKNQSINISPKIPINNDSNIPTTNTIPTTTQNNPSPTPDLTYSWQTYSNKLFSVSVPAKMAYDSLHSTDNSMHLTEKNTTGTTMRNAMDITIGFWQNPRGFTSCDSDESCYQIVLKSVTAGSDGKFETTQAEIVGVSRKGLLSWAVGKTVAPDTNVVYQFPISKNGNYFEFNFQIGNANLQEAQTNFTEIKQILSTFKFIK